MADEGNVIHIKKPPADAYNKHRRVSALHRTQMEHLTVAVTERLQEEMRAVKTEAEASQFIKKVTAILRQERKHDATKK